MQILSLLFPLIVQAGPLDCDTSALKFEVQPNSVVVNEPMRTIEVSAVDFNGRDCVEDNHTLVQLYLADGNADMLQNGMALPGNLTAPVKVKDGVAKFSNLSFSHASVIKLTAIDGAAIRTLNPADAQPFAVANYGQPERLRFIQQPTDNLKQAPAIAVMDHYGNLVTSDSNTVVTLDCVAPIGCALEGTLSVTVTNGVGYFNNHNLRVRGPLEGVHLRAQATSWGAYLVPDLSDSFDWN